MRRKIDFANATVNLTQLVAIIVFVWQAAVAYQEMVGRIGALQSQLGEANARLATLEGR